ncbi:uncharacterized protein LOC112190008 [Rosa chinensis]|uniref:uncharacterized protein LOC112190008 n=1 Tax=Rosa chinensis TaxID=74649 RepID=UPI001AD92B0B|nr:uncharacterized protein LOC112190008 [Rosa chinensis]
MDPEEENHASEDDLSSDEKKGRGPTFMSDIIHGRSKGARMEVTYNKKGQPIGLGGKRLATFIGVMARTTIPITYETWPAVKKSLKEMIWSMVQKSFIVDPRSKKDVLSSAGRKWKSFKSTLTTKYILKYKDRRSLLKKKPEEYEFITQPQWEAFVKSRLTPEFLEIHEDHSRRRAFHEYEHRMSRKGYANLEEELKLELGTEEDIDRAILWKKGRVDKEGNYLSETTKQRAEKIDALTKDVKEGIVSAVGRNDILTQALETPERPGRVRGAGQFVTHKVYFNTSRYKPATKTQMLEQQLEMMQNQINMFASLLDPEKLDAAKLSMMRDMFKSNNGSEKASCSVDKEKNQSCKEEVSNVASKKEIEKKATEKKVRKVDDIPSPIDNSRESKKAKQKSKGGLVTREIAALEDDNVITSTDKAYIPIQTTNVVKKANKCKLAVDTKDNIVAMGTIIMLDGPIHGVPLGAENARISVDVPIKEDAYLPIPNVSGDIFTVKQAIGTHVACPRHLVLMSHEEVYRKPIIISITRS